MLWGDKVATRVPTIVRVTFPGTRKTVLGR